MDAICCSGAYYEGKGVVLIYEHEVREGLQLVRQYFVPNTPIPLLKSMYSRMNDALFHQAMAPA